MGAGAQTIIRFDDEPGVWYVVDTYPQGSVDDPNFIGTNTLQYFYSGDTVITGSVWVRIYASSTSETSPVPVFHGYVRQSNDLVLFRDEFGVVDTLYDFGLQVDDSIHYASSFVDTFLSVTSIDSVLIQGAYHKVFNFSDHMLSLEEWLTDTWIEGIGSIHGPLAPRIPSTLGYNQAFPDSTRLTCYVQESITLWHHGAYPECAVNITLSLDDVDEDRLSGIWPNPFRDVVSVQIPGPGPWNFVISDLLGRIHMAGSVQTLYPSRALDLGALQPGTYLLKVSGIRSVTFRMIKT